MTRRKLIVLQFSSDWKKDPIAAIVAIGKLTDQAEAKLREAVREARRTGRTWEEIGAALRISKQSAWQRFGTRTRGARSRSSSGSAAGTRGR